MYTLEGTDMGWDLCRYWYLQLQPSIGGTTQQPVVKRGIVKDMQESNEGLCTAIADYHYELILASKLQGRAGQDVSLHFLSVYFEFVRF